MRYANKRDIAERQIVDALRDAGYLVWILNEPGDLLCQRRDGTQQLIEVKTGRGKLSKKQEETRDAGWVIPVVRTVAEAIDALDGAGG